MSDDQKAREEEVFDQELSLDELDAAAGGGDADGLAEFFDALGKVLSGGKKDADTNNCTHHDYRQIYGGGGFPNCATVEDGSRCERNDACYSTAVDYQGMTDCAKAWR